jgi:hypothetical protein
MSTLDDDALDGTADGMPGEVGAVDSDERGVVNVTSRSRGRTATAAYRTVVARARDRVHRATVSMSAAERSFS